MKTFHMLFNNYDKAYLILNGSVYIKRHNIKHTPFSELERR